ncbi:PQQ-like beta-propeller repeat protein [Candidatus Sumerlaeota bacterium]|nr:PQQ-like beta-propeller repeat protein [Candidatus Sumerlaeota bacterium]
MARSRIRTSFFFTLPAALCFLLLAPARGRADDWPQWRGEGRLGVWNETGILKKFPEGGLEFVWRVPIKEGYGGPAVADGRVFVTDFERAPRGEGTERLLCLDEKTGDVLWIHAWQTALRGLMPTYANGPRATPTVDGDRVYVQGSTGKLLCLSAEDGAVIWSRDYVEDFGTSVPIWGMAGSPLIDGDRLICLVGGEPNAKVMALDKMTGKEIWRSLPATSEPGYSSPVVIEAGGTRQLIMFHPTAISSLDPVTGSVYWEKPYEVSLSQTIATPVHSGAMLLVSSPSHGSTMLRLDPRKPAAEIAWKGQSQIKAEPDGLHCFNSTPYIEGDYVYGIGGMGRLLCIDARSGKEVWSTYEATENARIATAFLVRNGDRTFINNDRGELILARLTPEGYHEIDRAQLIEPTNPNAGVRRELGVVNWSHPAYANGHIFQRNDNEIVRASLEAP